MKGRPYREKGKVVDREEFGGGISGYVVWVGSSVLGIKMVSEMVKNRKGGINMDYGG